MSTESQTTRPKIRILHQMARSGGTIICRCLASMEGVVLLSEIHPAGLRMFNPLQQAMEWYALLTPDDIKLARESKLSFVQSIGLIAERCQQQNKTLVLRDWSHLDFIGIPFGQASYRSGLVEALQKDFDLLRYSTVRHPLDQWLSLTKNPMFAERLAKPKYLRGVRHFSDMAVSTGFLKYEQFTADPDTGLKQLCDGLDLVFDPAYRERWPDYSNITGDVLPGRSGPTEICNLPRQTGIESLAKAFESRSDYRRILEILGYSS
jgi:hypothetical protein